MEPFAYLSGTCVRCLEFFVFLIYIFAFHSTKRRRAAFVNERSVGWTALLMQRGIDLDKVRHMPYSSSETWMPTPLARSNQNQLLMQGLPTELGIRKIQLGKVFSSKEGHRLHSTQ